MNLVDQGLALQAAAVAEPAQRIARLKAEAFAYWKTHRLNEACEECVGNYEHGEGPCQVCHDAAIEGGL